MEVIWSLLKSPLGRYVMAGLAVLALVSGIYLKGRGDGSAGEKRAEAARVAKAVVKAAKVTTTLAVSAEKAGADASAERERIVYRTNTIIQRIPDEVPRTTDVRLGPGFLRLYNASLGLPESAGPAEGASDQPGLYSAEALAVIAPNNAECLKGWDAYRRVVTLYDQVQGSVNGFRP